MSAGEIIAVVVAILVVLLLVALLMRMQSRRRHLQKRFGPEYDRTVQERENRKEAEQELAERERRYSELDIRPLAPEQRDRYADDWQRVQEQFVDAPDVAVAEADRLVAVVMRERGYPTENYEQQLADLSVAHARTLEHYRTAHDIQQRLGSDASTEEMRRAMVHYRAVVTDLLGKDTDQLPTDRALRNGNDWRDETTANETTANETTANETTANETTANETTANETTANEKGAHRGGTADGGR